MISFLECRPGAMVECIDAVGCDVLTLHAVYSVDHAEIDESDPGTWGVVLNEVQVPEHYRAFSYTRFRLVPASRLDVFRAMLAPHKVELVE